MNPLDDDLWKPIAEHEAATEAAMEAAMDYLTAIREFLTECKDLAETQEQYDCIAWMRSLIDKQENSIDENDVPF